METSGFQRPVQVTTWGTGWTGLPYKSFEYWYFLKKSGRRVLFEVLCNGLLNPTLCKVALQPDEADGQRWEPSVEEKANEEIDNKAIIHRNLCDQLVWFVPRGCLSRGSALKFAKGKWCCRRQEACMWLQIAQRATFLGSTSACCTASWPDCFGTQRDSGDLSSNGLDNYLKPDQWPRGLYSAVHQHKGLASSLTVMTVETKNGKNRSSTETTWHQTRKHSHSATSSTATRTSYSILEIA